MTGRVDAHALRFVDAAAVRSATGEIAALHDAVALFSAVGRFAAPTLSSVLESNTALLGLVKHVTFVEGVWFDQAISGRSYAEIAIASTPARSFVLDDADTIGSVLEAYERRCEESRRSVDTLAFGAAVDGRGPPPVWALHVQVLGELAQHAGHADTLREQILARRSR